MAKILNISLDNDDIVISLRLSKKEYHIAKIESDNLMIAPTSNDVLNENLISGKLGNGNRIMLPNKILSRHEIPLLLKHLPAKIFDLDDQKILVIKLMDKNIGMNNFNDDSNEKTYHRTK